MEYDDKNTFILFYETDKKTDKSPDFTGKLTDINGKEWRIAAWHRSSKNGKEFLSGKVDEFKPKTEGGAWEQQRQKFAKKDVAPTEVSDISDEDFYKSIPF